MKLIIVHALKIILSGAACVLFASSCDSVEGFPVDYVNPTAGVQTNTITNPLLEETATPKAEQKATNLPTLQISATIDETESQIATLIDTLTQNSVPCNLAVAGNPLDVTIPDDTRLSPGENFSKIWRLTNSGACAWTPGYSIVWFSGDDFSANHLEPVFSTVKPGESVEFSVDMTAPITPGIYSGYWKLQSESGESFGIGPGGNSPFWVRVQVIAVETATTTVTPTTEPTSIVLVSGSISFLPGQFIDLDTGELDDFDQSDGMLEQIGPESVQWAAINNGRFGIFGLSQPGEMECRLATLSDQSLDLETIEVGTSICYRTGEGLPGMMQITTLPVGGSPLEFYFTTWAIP